MTVTPRKYLDIHVSKNTYLVSDWLSVPATFAPETSVDHRLAFSNVLVLPNPSATT